MKNPIMIKLENKEYGGKISLEKTLGSVCSCVDCTPWFADFAKLPAGISLSGYAVWHAKKLRLSKSLPQLDPYGGHHGAISPPKRFGAPCAHISDRGTFLHKQFNKGLLKYGVTHRLSIAYHPQTSGQDVRIFEASRVAVFVLRSQELHNTPVHWESDI
ncbi:reverse transcriptase domain-containing protein [Tanacetum coccineum]